MFVVVVVVVIVVKSRHWKSSLNLIYFFYICRVGQGQFIRGEVFHPPPLYYYYYYYYYN